MSEPGAGAEMRRFWDRRAREDAAFFVDDRLAYGEADLDQLWAEGEQALANFERLLGVSPGPADTVLEIGCGIGRMTRAIAARAKAVIALDVSAEMLAEARRLNPQLDNVTWLEGDGVSLAGVGDGDVDACISFVVFQHIPDPEVTLGYVREMGRVLAPDGWSAFGVSDDPTIHLPRGEYRVPGQESPFWLGSAVDLDELGEAARAGGLEVERVSGAGTQFCLVRLGRSPVRRSRTPPLLRRLIP